MWDGITLAIPKIHHLHRWSLEMDTEFHPKLYQGCNYLYMLGLKLNKVCKRCLRGLVYYKKLAKAALGLQNHRVVFFRVKQWNIITHPLTGLDSTMVYPPLKLENGWVITSIHERGYLALV